MTWDQRNSESSRQALSLPALLSCPVHDLVDLKPAQHRWECPDHEQEPWLAAHHELHPETFPLVGELADRHEVLRICTVRALELAEALVAHSSASPGRL